MHFCPAVFLSTKISVCIYFIAREPYVFAVESVQVTPNSGHFPNSLDYITKLGCQFSNKIKVSGVMARPVLPELKVSQLSPPSVCWKQKLASINIQWHLS